jgi:hypothetical protein
MDKVLNVVYDAFGAPEIYYQGPEGTVWYSNKRNENTYNVYMSACHNPNPDDSCLMTEPIVTDPSSYDLTYLSKFRKVFGCFDKAFENTPIQDKYVPINYGTEIVEKNADQLRSAWPSWEQRKPGVIIVAAANKISHHPASIYKLRILLADFLYENKFEVDWYGYANCNRPYYRGVIPTEKDKIAKIGQYRFAICTENTYDRIYSYNYLTEKLPQTIYGGALPLYMGCHNIDELAPEHTIFDLRNFVIKDSGKWKLLERPLLEALNSFTKEKFERYREATYQYLKSPTGISYHADMKRFLRQMLKEYYP